MYGIVEDTPDDVIVIVDADMDVEIDVDVNADVSHHERMRDVRTERYDDDADHCEL